MSVQMMSPNQIRSAGIAALAKSLGPTGMARFIQQFDTGTGDYTKDRNQWLNHFTLDDIVSGIHTMRNSHPSIEKK